MKNKIWFILLMVIISIIVMQSGKKVGYVSMPITPEGTVLDAKTDTYDYGSYWVQGNTKYAAFFFMGGIQGKTKLKYISIYGGNQDPSWTCFIMVNMDGINPADVFNRYDRWLETRCLNEIGGKWFLIPVNPDLYTPGHMYGIWISSNQGFTPYTSTNPNGVGNYLIKHTSGNLQDPAEWIYSTTISFLSFVEPECITDSDCPDLNPNPDIMPYCNEAGTPNGECKEKTCQCLLGTCCSDGCAFDADGTSCGTNMHCDGNGNCIQSCASHHHYGCFNNDVYWYNSCSIREELAQDCGVNGCSGGQCISTTYSDFMGYKSSYLSGGSFSSFISSANKWVSP